MSKRFPESLLILVLSLQFYGLVDLQLNLPPKVSICEKNCKTFCESYMNSPLVSYNTKHLVELELHGRTQIPNQDFNSLTL